MGEITLTNKDLETILEALNHRKEAIYDARKQDDGSYQEALNLAYHQIQVTENKVKEMLEATK